MSPYKQLPLLLETATATTGNSHDYDCTASFARCARNTFREMSSVKMISAPAWPFSPKPPMPPPRASLVACVADGFTVSVKEKCQS
jgi:hypothetical protein